jgi:hypothetical protein
MANRRSINSPGVEIREIDLSTRATAPNGTSVFVTGFASQGPTSEIINVSTIAEFENIYGTPTNAAERYFYYTVRQAFTAGTNAVVNVARLPYGDDTGDGFSSKYSALVYPVIATSTASIPATGSAIALSAANYYYFTAPTLIELSETDYNSIKQGNISWSGVGTAYASAAPTITDITSLSSSGIGLVVLNEAKTTINEKFEGYYFNLADNTNLNPTSNYDDAKDIKTITVNAGSTAPASYQTVPTTRLGFSVSATSAAGINSLSQDIENIPTYNIATGTGYDDTAIFSLVKVRVTPFEKNSLTLSYNLQEGYTTSFYSNRTIQDPNGGPALNNFAGTVINDVSPNLTVLINPKISNQTTWLDASGNAQKYIRILNTATATAPITTLGYRAADSLFPLGVYSPSLDTTTAKIIGNVGAKLDTVLNLAENPDAVTIDVVVDGGLSTISAGTSASIGATFDDVAYNTTISTELTNLASTSSYTPGSIGSAWKAITDKFVEFTTFRRKDCVYIADPLRYIFVQGENFKTLDDKSKNFSSNIYWPLRNQFSTYNTSYATTYGNWVKTVDSFSNKPVWLPFSGFAGAIYTRNDAVAFPWGAPAGLNRGVVTGITDLAVNPQQKQRDLLYKVSINPVVNFPQEGFTIMGQKTLLKAPSAFDRINVRRLFLYLEKSVLNTTKFFVFEPNTTFTRNRLVNTISPVFDLAKNTQGVFDYLIVCNETNNTADIVDDNTLVVDIYIKPTRTAEFILVNFYATRTSQSFQELLQ